MEDGFRAATNYHYSSVGDIGMRRIVARYRTHTKKPQGQSLGVGIKWLPPAYREEKVFTWTLAFDEQAA